MDAALEKLTKQQLIDLLTEERLVHQQREAQVQAEKAYLQAQLEQALRKLFGQSRERFEDPNQLTLPFAASTTSKEKQEAQTRQQQTRQASKEKKTNPNHKGRKPLPKHLPVEEVEIHPEGDLSDQVCIGKEISEALDYIPGHYIIRRYIRYKYVPKTTGGNTGETTRVAIADLPERVIDRCKAGSGLLASLLVDKYVDHLPLYRQHQRLLREKIPIAPSTLEGWAAQAMERLAILYEHLLFSIKSKGYLQVDEPVPRRHHLKYWKAIRKGSVIWAISGCTTAHWIKLCCLIISLPAGKRDRCPSSKTLKAIFKPTGMKSMINW